MENKNIIPVLIGADMNCYNVARAFHEQYGVKSYAFGRYAIGASNYTRIIKFTVVEKLDDPEVMVKTLTDFAEKHEGATLIAFGCTDDYASMLIHYGDRLRPRYIVPYIGPELFERLAYKASFYEDCDRHGILYPKTKIVTPESDLETILDEDSLGFEYPIIIKPSASAVYWHYPFDGMKKVYTAASKGEAEIIIRRIYGSGYPEKIILQDMIPCNLVLDLKNTLEEGNTTPFSVAVVSCVAMRYQITNDINSKVATESPMYYGVGLGRAGTHIITHDIKSTVNQSSDLNVAQALSTGGSSGAITMDIAVKDEVESPHYEGVGVGMAFTKIITHDINSKATNSGNTTVASPVNTATVITIN